MDEPTPWPRSDSTIFDPEPSQLSASLAWAQGRAYGYEEGYRRAAEILFREMAERGRSLDMLVFPFAFLWRHSIELQLKHLIERCGVLLDDDEDRPPLHHRLVGLWEEAKRRIVEICGEQIGMEGVDRVVAELDQLDPESTGFRYPTDRKGRPNLSSPPAALDLPNFHLRMQEVQMFLDCANTDLAHQIDCLGELPRGQASW